MTRDIINNTNLRSAGSVGGMMVSGFAIGYYSGKVGQVAGRALYHTKAAETLGSRIASGLAVTVLGSVGFYKLIPSVSRIEGFLFIALAVYAVLGALWFEKKRVDAV